MTKRARALMVCMALMCMIGLFAAQAALAASDASTPSQDGLLEVRHLGTIHQSGSVGMPLGGRPAQLRGPTYPQSFDISRDGEAAFRPFTFSSTVTPESDLPGVCAGGVDDGDPCLDNTDCTAPGTCNLYRSNMYQNENTTGFTTTSSPRNPVLDDVQLAGSLAIPPAQISSVEFAFVPEAGGIPMGSTMRVEIRFWDTLNTAVSPVNSGLLGGGSFLIPGPVASGFFYTQIGILSPPYPAPSDPNIAFQIDYRDNTTNALQYATILFANPPGGPQLGATQNLYFRDANSNGQFDSTDARSFAAPNSAAFYLHLGGEYPTAESEPNNTQLTATNTVACLGLNAAITPVADVDWYKFTTTATQTLVMEASCGNVNDDSTLTLRNSGGGQIDFNDDVSGTNRCSKITRSLTAGTYFLEVHEKGDNATIPAYVLGVGPTPPVVTNLKIGTVCSPSCTNKHSIVWDAVTGGAPYDIVYGDLQTLHSSGINAAVQGCLADDRATPDSDDGDSPAPDQGFFYMVRSRNQCTHGSGTYQEGGETARDPQMPAPPFDCNAP